SSRRRSTSRATPADLPRPGGRNRSHRGSGLTPAGPRSRVPQEPGTMRWMIVMGCVAVSLWGCGYALVGRASNLPPDVEAIAIRTFENRTARVGVEQILTRAVNDELVTRQRYRIVGEDSEAQARLSG